MDSLIDWYFRGFCDELSTKLRYIEPLPQKLGLFYAAQRATDAYQKDCAVWDEAYGEKATPKTEIMHEKLQRYKEKADRQNANQPYHSIDKGAR